MHLDIVDSAIAGAVSGSLDGPPLRRSAAASGYVSSRM